MQRSLRHLVLLPGALALGVLFSGAVIPHVDAAVYQDYVMSLSPTYYFELNETDTSQGVLDSVSGQYFGSFNGDYSAGFPFPEVGAPGPDLMVEGGAWSLDGWAELGDLVPVVGLGPDNVAHASANEGHINLGDQTLFGAEAMTVSLFARGNGAQGGDRLFTNNIPSGTNSFQIVVGNDGLVVSVDPTVGCDLGGACGHRSLFFPEQGGDGFTGTGADRGLLGFENGWFHIVASTEGSTVQERVDNIRVWLNGVDRTADMKPGTTGWGTDTTIAKIGGRRDDPTDSTTHSGEQDEVAIWLDRVLTDQEAAALWAAATDPNFVPPMPTEDADFDGNGVVDGADFVIWQSGFGIATGASASDGDADANGLVNSADFAIWEAQFGTSGAGVAAIPEPTGCVLLVLGALAGCRRRR